MIEIVMIRLPENVPEPGGSHPLIRMVGTVLSDSMPASEKKEILEKEYGIKMTQEGERRLTDMCNLSEGILEKGIEKGIQKGIALEKESSIRTSVEIYKDEGYNQESTTKQIAARHHLSLQDARMEVKKFW